MEPATLAQATEFTALVIGVGGASAVIVKGVRALRRFGHFVDRLAGNGKTEPGVLKRLDDLKDAVAHLSDGQVLLVQSVDDVSAKLHQHVDVESKALMADGQAWASRIDALVADLESRVAALEGRTPAGPARG